MFPGHTVSQALLGAARRETFPSRFKAEPRRPARKQVSMGPVLGWRPRGQGAGRAPGCRLCEENMVSPGPPAGQL